MTTNKVTPSGLATVWDGNLDSFVHTNRPGNSQKASIRQIVEAAVAAMPATPEQPSSGWSGSLDTGTVVIMPTGEYDDYLGNLRTSLQLCENPRNT